MTNKFSTIKERILYLLECKKVTKSKFFEEIGMTYGNFTGENKKKPINSDAITNILSKFPDVSSDWLITGREPMLRETKRPDFEKTVLVPVGDKTDTQHEVSNKKANKQENSAIIDKLLQRLESQSKEIGRLESENNYLSSQLAEKNTEWENVPRACAG